MSKKSQNGPLAGCSTENSWNRTPANIENTDVIHIDVLLLLKRALTKRWFFSPFGQQNSRWAINLYILTCNQKDQNMKKLSFQDGINRLSQYCFRMTYKTFECCWRPFVIHKLLKTITKISHSRRTSIWITFVSSIFAEVRFKEFSVLQAAKGHTSLR